MDLVGRRFVELLDDIHRIYDCIIDEQKSYDTDVAEKIDPKDSIELELAEVYKKSRVIFDACVALEQDTVVPDHAWLEQYVLTQSNNI